MQDIQEIEHIGKYQAAFSKTNRIGDGSFGEVYIGSHSQTKFKVAIKVLKKDPNSTIQEVIKIKQAEILKCLQSPNIVRLYDIARSSTGQWCIVFQYCDSDFDKQISSRPEKEYLPEEKIIHFLRQICNGYKILYQNNVIHRDIKPGNILIKNGVYKLADFGLARYVDHMEFAEVMSKVGTLSYVAPQLSDNPYGQKRPIYSSKCDVWSLGIVLYQLIYFKDPFREGSKAIKKMNKKELPFPNVLIERSEKLTELLKLMLKYQEKDRIDWPEIFTHELLVSINQRDPIKEQAIAQVYKILKFYKNIYQYINQVCSLLASNKDITNAFRAELTFMSILLFDYRSLHYCKKIISSLFSKESFHPLIDDESYRIFRTSDKYWECLNLTQKNQKILIEQIKKNKINLSKYQKTIPTDLQPAYNMFIKKQNQVIEEDEIACQVLGKHIITALTDLTNISKQFQKRVEKALNPSKSFSLEFKFEKIKKK